MLASLVYRYGPADADAPRRPAASLANGQVTAVRREALLAAGGYAPAAGHMTDDAALARALAARAGGSRSSTAPRSSTCGCTSRRARPGASGAARSRWPTSRRRRGRRPTSPSSGSRMALPVLRLAAGRPTRLDLALLALRRGAAGAAGAAPTRGAARRFWLSPLADPATAVRLTLSAVRRRGPGAAGRIQQEQRADQRHERAGRHHVLDRVGGELDDGEREHAGAGAPLERRRRG